MPSTRLVDLAAASFQNDPMPISHVQLFSVPVSDPDRARAFYVETLGFELVADTEMGPGMRWVQVRPPGAATSLTLVTWFPTMPAGTLKGTVLETDALEERRRRRSARKGVR